MNNEDTGSNGIDLFGYATAVLKEINHAAFSKLDDPKPYLMDNTIQAAATILDTGGRTKKNAIYARSRQEKLEGGEDFGSWEYYYKPDACQRTVDWILENDPMATLLGVVTEVVDKFFVWITYKTMQTRSCLARSK